MENKILYGLLVFSILLMLGIIYFLNNINNNIIASNNLIKDILNNGIILEINEDGKNTNN